MTRDERQELARVKWIKNKCKGCIVAATGFGKTNVALKSVKSIIDKYPNIKFLVIVPTDNLKLQWENNIDKFGLTFNSSVEIVNTAIKNQYVTDILVLDECHRFNSTTFRSIFDTIKYRYILGLTATFERLDNLHKEVMSKYCPVIDTISLAECLANQWVSPYKEYQVIINVDDINIYKEYNKEFISHFGYFNFDWSLVMSLVGKEGYINRAKYRDKICPNGTEQQRKDTFRDITYHATAFMRALQARKKFINNHPKKLEIARKIIAARPDSKIITFSNNIKMAEAIGMGGEVYTGKDSKKKARANLEEFNLKEKAILHSVAKLNEGADVRGLSVAIILGLDSSKIKSVQRLGRTIRFEPGKTAEVFNIVIADTVESSWFTNSHPDGNYITIGEEGLDDVLNYKEPRLYKHKIKDITFRF